MAKTKLSCVFFTGASKLKAPIAITVAMVLLAAITAIATKHTINPSFYYWKTQFKLSKKENGIIKELASNEIFIRYFDVDWNQDLKEAKPIGVIDFYNQPPLHQQVIPVVFITNRVFSNLNSRDTKQLAEEVLSLVLHITNTNNLMVDELQIDCDWSESTRNNYFLFLKELTNKLKQQDMKSSATIRLHQIKHHQRTGIPPVDRGMLMFYNMGNLKNNTGRNSIFNTKDAAPYMESIKEYPLPLDVALPIFSWAVHVRNEKVIELLSNTYLEELTALPGIEAKTNNLCVVNQPQYFRGSYLKRGDHLRLETVDKHLALEAAKLLSKHINRESRRVVLFRLDSLTIDRYEKEDIHAIIDCFR
ncbi:MAG: hypothetical protein ACWA6U_01400 [Breznakibacter sp.]